MYKSCKLANKSRRGEEKENKLMKEEEIGGVGGVGAGKARVEACCQFQTNHFMYIPSSSS